jgi:hypothetical protein
VGAWRQNAGLPFANRKACANQRSSTIRNPHHKANGYISNTYVIFLHFKALSALTTVISALALAVMPATAAAEATSQNMPIDLEHSCSVHSPTHLKSKINTAKCRLYAKFVLHQ